MAQLDFYFNRTDKLELAKFLFARSCILVPSIHYRSNQYCELKRLSEYEQYIDQSCLMHILHRSFSHLNLSMDSFDKGGEKVFYIQQRNGGPTIDFYSPGRIVEYGTTLIGCGFISIYPYYWNGDMKISSTSELKTFYKEVRKFIIERSSVFMNNHRRYYLGLGTSQDLLAGHKLVDMGFAGSTGN